MCRMCLVEVKGPRGFALMPACYNPVADGMEIVTDCATAKKAQEGVLEFLLVNHPLDCPVCDKGGECPLQDQTLAYGPGETRFVEEKRHWEKPIPISDLVLLDRERCIQCGRCVRFADEVAGDPLIDFAERGDVTEVATFPDEPFASYFSGNMVQICPVGALTAKPYRFKARPWDLEQVESTLHLLLGGLPGRRAVEFGELITRLPRRRLRSGQLGLAVRQGSLRLRGRQQRGPGDRPRSSARATSWSRRAGPRPWPPPPTASARSERSAAARRSRCHRRGPAAQRGRLRLGQAGPHGARHRQRRRPARRRPPRRGGPRPAPGDHRPGLPRLGW